MRVPPGVTDSDLRAPQRDRLEAPPARVLLRRDIELWRDRHGRSAS